ncbi:Toll/interleukin-1 receptor domain-containing protein [Tanacetum coccineum]
MEAEKYEEKKIQAARKLESWTKALKEVADLKGKDVNSRRETVFIEEIVKEISTGLDLHRQSKIPHLIVMESFIDTISSWLKGGSSDTTEIITIWGMAGIEKTSLAKPTYWLHQHEFDRSSFVENIETICGPQSSTLLHLQNQLLKDMLNKSISEEHNVDVCTSKIQKALLNKQVFVVLDGVDNHEQVDVLVGRKGFHPGSKIIITTKDASLTEKCALFRMECPPNHTSLALEGLGGTDSLRLLCWHAFGGYAPKEGYEVEVTRASK